MTRPGFVIPNANLVAPDYQAAQPDQGDFLVLGNEKYGVIAGCKPVLSFPAVSLATDLTSSTANILVCAGTAYLLASGVTTHLAAAGAQGRWDLIVFDSKNGGFRAVTGTPADNPAYPDLTDTMTLLAAVSVPAAASGATPTLIDKRVFLPQTLVGDATTPSLARTYDTSSPTPQIVVNIDGRGKINWDSQTALEKLSPGVLKVTSELDANTLRCNQLFVGGVQLPQALPPPPEAVVEVPSGSVIMSLVSASQMAGWLQMIGQSVPVGSAGNLPTLFPGWVSGGMLTLPDMRGRFPVGGGFINSSSPGFVSGTNPNGSVVDDHGTMSASVGIDQMPPHVHRTGNVTDAIGDHQHNIPIWAAFQPQGGVVSNVGSANTNGVTIATLTNTGFAGSHAHGLPAHISVGGGQPLHITPPTLSLYFYIKT